ncbi:MAG: BACON domain-containing protein [Alistipes sp.]|nr:BACON domain-containing protein [Alistipes sp.]
MKLRNFFYLLLALPLFIAGCTESNTDEPTPKEVKLELTSEASLSFEAEGGNGEISYLLENIIEGVGLTATCEANWVSDITLGDKITFVVAANEGEARDTKIVVGYSDKSFEVAIQQKAYEPVITNEYLYDETLAFAERVDLSDYGFPSNYYLIAFYTEDGNILLGAVIVGAEGEDILSAGTYTSANGGLLMEGFELYVGEEEEYFFEGGNGEIVVGGDIEGYTFDIKIADVDGNKFHFTYEGTVNAMNLSGNLPTEPVNITLDTFNGEYYGTQYSPTYNYYIVLSDKGLNADGYAQAGGTYYQIDLYGVEGEVDADGYIAIPAGTYTFDAIDTMAEWTMGNYYSGYAKVNAEGTGYEAQVSYESGEAIVTANGITLKVVIGGVEHTVTYTGAPKIYVGVPADDVEFKAQYAYAYYFGDQYTPGYADNYYLFLSDLGLDEEGYEMANGTYYRFDIYTPLGDGTKIPAGTYTIDMTDSGDLWTATLSYSGYYVLDEYAWDYVENDYPASGTIVVGEDGSITAEVTMLMSGTNHSVVYSGGNITIYDMSEGEGGEGGGTYSTLESDWNCNLSDHTLYYEAYGDWYEVGYQNWVIAIMPNSQEGDFVQFDILGGTDSSSFAGEYTISDSLGSYTAYPGYIDEGYMSGGWYYTEDGYTMAPFVDGWLDITDNGDSTFTVEFDVWDDADYNITGKWTGELHPASELMQATRSNAKLRPSLVVAEQKPARSKESFRVVKPVQQSEKKAVKKGLNLR